MNVKKGLKSVMGSMLVWTFVISVVSIAFLGVVTYEATKASVQVTQDGETHLVRTHANTVGELLSELDVTVEQQDELSHKRSKSIQFGMDINYISSKSINLVIDDQSSKQHYTTANTVGEFFEEEGLSFNKRDELSHKKSTVIRSGLNIQVNQAIQVTLKDGGSKEKNVWTTASTVKEFLQNQEVTLSQLDKLKPALEEDLTEKTPVTITRIEKVTDIVEEQIDYTVETRRDQSMSKGEKRVVSSGEKGTVTKEYEVTLKNGEKVSRQLVKETVEKESKKKIVAVGTKPTTTVSRGNDNHTRTLYMQATAYTANCTGCSGITKTGINLKSNPGKKVIAVDPNVIPLGSRVWVEGYGYAVAGDIGSAIQGNRIDLFISSRSQALNYGRKNVQVKILD